MKAIIVWGNQLSIDHNSALLATPQAPIFLIESWNACRKHRYHKQKIVFVLSAMRSFCDALQASGRTVYYVRLELGISKQWFDSLGELCNYHQVTQLVAMRQNDRLPQLKLEQWCRSNSIGLETTPNSLFLTSQSAFADWAEDHTRTQMEVFYRWQRRRLNVLVEPKAGSTKDVQPVGGSWNYDADNRAPLPKDIVLPKLRLPQPTQYTVELISFVGEHFADNPGLLPARDGQPHNGVSWWLPTTRQQALDWLKQFLAERFGQFGKYEDAMRASEPFLYHSALSPLLNLGLLHPREVVAAALAADNIPLAGKEGFVRQIIGWREFMHSLYHYKPLEWKRNNLLNQTKKLEEYWWQLDETQAPEVPIADVFKRLKTYGYTHHIERLMVLGNYMLLSGYDPYEVYEWFLCMFVDAYEWVMVPNVIGMSQYADGGLDKTGFASKPYISGSNYLQKMGKWWPSGVAANASSYTRLYWDFLDRHKDILGNNHRLRPLYANRKRYLEK